MRIALLIVMALTAILACAYGEAPSLQAESSLITTALVDRQAMGTFIIDTGSTFTTITPEMAKNLNLEVTDTTPRETILTANGRRAFPRVMLRSVLVGKTEVRDVPAIVMAVEDDPLLAGLLGMSFLNRVTLRIEHGQVSIGKE